MKSYDIIIIGGGIAGLNIAYQLAKRRDTVPQRVLLLESLDHLGGRVYTYNSKTWNNIPLEAGAGRFHKGHTHLFSLIKDLNLEENVKSIGRAHLRHLSHGVEMTTNVQKFIKRIINRAKNVPIEILREQSIITFIRRRAILSEEELAHLIGFYGYYSELEIMNAYDAIELFKTGTNPDNEFFVLRGGLSQIVQKMERVCSEADNIRILKNKTVLNVWRRECDSARSAQSSRSSKSSGSRRSGGFAAATATIMLKCQDGTEYACNKCIFALPKPCFEKFSIICDAAAGNAALHRCINSVECAPLCRIYSYYDNTRNRWIKEQIHDRFDGGKITMDNMLRFLIPINDNMVMTSYSDNVFAEWWKKKYDKGGIVSINHEITWQLRDAFKVKNIPVANKTRIFYWDCGVGYWKVGANSKEAAAEVLRCGVRDLFICGENYSEKNQQWVEGALETSEKVLTMLV